MGIKIKRGEEGFWNTFEYHTGLGDEFRQECYNYIICGYRPGGFHTAVFANDLFTAACRSHPSNEWRNIIATVKWFLEFAPMESYGSYENVDAWLKMSSEDRREIAELKRWVLPEDELVWEIISEDTQNET